VLALPDEPLKPCNTLALQARARLLVRADRERDLHEALALADREGRAVVPLGEGSNVVLAGDLDALVLRVNTRGIIVLDEDAQRVLLRVAAGEPWHRFVDWTLARGYSGLENLALIPGTVGAAPVQNIGAYGVELAGCLRSVHALSIADGAAVCLAAAECAFGYRDSVFKGRLKDRLVITAVDLELSRIPRLHTGYPALAQALAGRDSASLTPRDVFDAVVAIRRSRLPDPAREPNAGSFFKNPVVDAARAAALARDHPALPAYPQPEGGVKLAAAWLIEQCGWRGYRADGVGVHLGHALVLVNYGSDSGRELLQLAGEIAASVQARFGVALEIEPRVYGGTP